MFLPQEFTPNLPTLTLFDFGTEIAHGKWVHRILCKYFFVTSLAGGQVV